MHPVAFLMEFAHIKTTRVQVSLGVADAADRMQAAV